MNKNKSIPFVLGSIAIIIAFAVVFIQYNNKDQGSSYTPKVSTESSATPPTTIKSNTKSSTTSNTTVTKNPNEYTLAQVATHNTSSNCWTAINGSVYNVTSWIGEHPGGSGAIISLCGIDGSDAFNGQHGGQRRPANELASFKIGTLK